MPSQDAETSCTNPQWVQDFAKLGVGAKCGYCAVVSVVVVACVTPFTMFVGPSFVGKIFHPVAQIILDNTVISLPNSTLNPCSCAGADCFSWVTNHAKLMVPSLGMATTLHPYTQRLYTTTCLKTGPFGPSLAGGWSCNNSNKTFMGDYTSPEMRLGSGDNDVLFNVSMNITSPPGIGGTGVLLGFISPMFNLLMTGYERSRLILEADDMSVTVFGITIRGLKMRNVLTCQLYQNNVTLATTPQQPLPNRICYPDDLSHTPLDQNQGFSMMCSSDGTEPLKIPTTTTTTTTTIANKTTAGPTKKPTTPKPTTPKPTTPKPTTPKPTTPKPTTAKPTTAKPTTPSPSPAPTTASAAEESVVV